MSFVIVNSEIRHKNSIAETNKGRSFGNMIKAAFSEDGKYYSALTEDGRLRIWDTETNALKQEYTPDLHLTSSPTCLQWICVSQSAGQKGARKKSVSEPEAQCLALGTSSGKILIYSISQAKVDSVLLNKTNADSHNTTVTSLDWHPKYGLYSCNRSNFVCEWDLQSASVKSKYNINIASKNNQGNFVTAIKLVPHNEKTSAKFLVAASWQIRVWRLNNSEASLIKCLGHNTSPKALLTIATLKNTCWLIEGSQNERLLAFWDVTITDEHLPQQNGEEVTPSKRSRKKSISNAATVPIPTYNFVLEDAPRIVDVQVRSEDNGNKLRMAAATRSGVVHYYGHMLNGSSSKPIKPSVTIQVTTADARPMPLQCCSVHAAGDLVLGYMTGPVLVFERITPDTKTKTQVLIRGEVKEAKVKQNDVNKVRSDHAREDVTYVEPMGGVSRKRPTPGGKVEVSMEARLANLALDVKTRSKSAVSQNLTKLLVQVLHSKDKGLILMVLQRDEPAVAARTVAALPADYVPHLLEQLADMATRKTSQCAAVCTWLAAVLRSHSALLLAAAGARASDHLTQLLAIFTHRRSHLCQLLNLRGRLQLTAAQRSERDLECEHQDPILEYNDTSSDEEMEVTQYHSDSERSWEDAAQSDAGSGHEEND